jgi:gamma-glutamyltranspeptidase / glutathione hydrolase
VTANFDWTNPYPTTRTPVFARNVVATSQPLAAQAGLRMLAAGGSAVDAVVAAAAALTLVEPCSNGLGSDAFAILWDGERLHGLNASGWSPAAWDRAYFEKRHGGNIPQRGWDSVTVPGAVAGWAALHGRFGRLPFEACLAPAIEYAERGYTVSPVVHHKWVAHESILGSEPGFAEHFLPRGRAPAIGERFIHPSAASTLRRLAATRGRDLYEGETAARIVAHAKANGAAMTLADMDDYRPDWVEPIGQDYRGHRLHEIPPNGQGIAALIALGILQHFDMASLPVDSVESRHLQIEAMKAAFADVYAHVGDPRDMRVTPAQLLDPAYLAERARMIRRDRATEFAHGVPPKGGTIYLTAADDRGMMVSFIQSNYMGFGSGVVVPGTGVSMQNRGAGFVTDAAHANCVAPRKRPFQTIIPAFLTKDGQPLMSFGVMGGPMQPQGHLQTLVRMLDHGQSPQAACDAPRWKVEKGWVLDVEPQMAADVVAGLRALGHRIEPRPDAYMDFGSGQFIWRLGDAGTDGYVAASDSRRDGQAVGF